MASLKDISVMLNDGIIPLIAGEPASVEPDLRNITDFGTMVANLDVSQVKDYTNMIISQVVNMFKTDEYKAPRVLESVDETEYFGLLQSVKTDFVQAVENRAVTLNTSTTYDMHNHWYGYQISNKVFEKSVAYRFISQVSKEMFKEAFKSASDMANFWNMIISGVKNSIERTESANELTLLSSLVIASNDCGHAVNLVTAFNGMVDRGVFDWYEEKTIGTDEYKTQVKKVTATNCMFSPYFKAWCRAFFETLTSRMRIANKTYNDGTITTWSSDSSAVFGEQFKSIAPDYAKFTPMWNSADTTGAFPIPFPNDMFSNIEMKSDEQGVTRQVLQGVVGVMYAKGAVGRTTRAIPVRTAINEDGNFCTTFYDYVSQGFIDTRENIVSFYISDTDWD